MSHIHNWVTAAPRVPQDRCARCAAIGIDRPAQGHVRVSCHYPQVCEDCALYVIQRRQKNGKMKALGVSA